MKMTTRKIVYYAMFAALTVICSQIAVPLPGSVPMSLSTFAVMLAGALLGTWGGAVSQLVYVLLGAVGVPVFAGFQAGLGRLAGPTGGFIIGFIVMALVIGLIISRFGTGYAVTAAAMAAGTAACYLFGTVWYIVLMKSPLLPALGACVLPFLPGDLLKILLAAFCAVRLRRAVKLSPA